MSLIGKVAIVTGASQGLGRVFAKEMASQGAKVVIADINSKKAYKVEKEITKANNEAIAITVDVSKEEKVVSLVQEVIDKYGRIDILVNNAAIFSTIKLKRFEDINVEEWSSMMDVNLKGVFLMCKAVLPYMKKGGIGRIINMSSATVLEGRPFYAHYVSSKAGVVGFTRAIARELGEFNITVNTISPGPMFTEIHRETVSNKEKENILEKQSIKKFGSPDDLVGAMLYLCSNQADFITGQLINIDGGLTMH